MPTTTTRRIKLSVPAETSRDQLLVFARTVIRKTLRHTHFDVQSMTISHSKCEKPGEMTYRIEFVNLMPN